MTVWQCGYIQGSYLLSSISFCAFSLFFFFNDTATTEIYTLSLHDALPILILPAAVLFATVFSVGNFTRHGNASAAMRSEEHTSELQSQSNLVCRLLLEKKKKQQKNIPHMCTRDNQETIQIFLQFQHPLKLL